MKHDFSLAKNRAGIYINLPDFSWSCQVQPGKDPTPEMIETLKAAFEAYQAVEDKHRAASRKGRTK